ncbi:MAG: tetratricopeptide repeat protein [Firmicutes bacterium]|nr:tetratricopeptide repeat protein [Bacillota bacterium]MCL5040528.1 tetratricopeptide repeat protein [Bacillota bacterium]
MTSDINRLHQEADQFFARGDLARAREIYLTILHLDPRNAQATNRLGAILAEEGDLSAAEPLFRQALELDPAMAAAWSNLGNLHYSRSDWDEAVACYRKALDLDPDYATAHNNLAAAYKKMGRLGDAVTELKKAQRLGLRSLSRPPQAKEGTGGGLFGWRRRKGEKAPRQ